MVKINTDPSPTLVEKYKVGSFACCLNMVGMTPIPSVLQLSDDLPAVLARGCIFQDFHQHGLAN